MNKKIVVSGMRPTGKLHLGHWVGALSNWVKLQKEHKCFFMIADWHAFMSEYRNPSAINQISVDNVADWLSYGVNPADCVMFIQSQVPEHLELFMILSAITPLGWLSRCPTFKEQVKQLKDRDVNTYAFFGYPALQSADIILYKSDFVPVGEDQLPHLELCREIVRRFNTIYNKQVFIEPQAMLTLSARLLGIDGRKMSKSYDNYIALDEHSESLQKKVLLMFTDPERKFKNDPGHPDRCNVFDYHSIFNPQHTEELKTACKSAKHGCRECKTILAETLEKFISPYRQKKVQILKDKNYILDVLEDGRKKAKKVASETLAEVKDIVKLNRT